jgi:trk system potassium uptake protein
MKVIILGCSRQGARLALLMEAEKYEVTVIDNDASSFSRLENFKGRKIVGNGVDVEVLKKAGIEETDAFASVTNGDNRNLMAAQIAKEIFNVPKVVCRVYDPNRAFIYHEFGLETVSATTVGARMIRNLLINPKGLRTYQLGDGTAYAVEFKLGAKTVGKSIKEIEIPNEYRIASVVRNQEAIVPTDDFVLQEGDQVFGVVKIDTLELLKDSIGICDFVDNFPKGG